MSNFRRILATALPVTSAVLAGSYYFCDDLKSFAATVVDSQNSYFSQLPAQNIVQSGYFNESYAPLTRWNNNWDNREPMALINQKKFASATDDEKKEMLQKVTPTATRYIFLIRHGQYVFHSEEQGLTELGREQAAILGKRLAISDMKFNKVIMSTMTRATETAQIMLQQMDKSIPSQSDSMLEEGAPYPPEPAHKTWKPKQREFFTDGSRIEAAFRKYIHRASPKQKEDSYEVIVCHGNVIRYFLCRALQFPPEGWLRLSIGHTSITWLAIRPNGYVSLRSYGDVGHLPADKLTFS